MVNSLNIKLYQGVLFNLKSCCENEKVMCYDMRYDHYLPFIPYSIRTRDIALVPNTFVYTI